MTRTASWVCLTLLISTSSSLYYFPASVFKICGRPLANATAPMRTHAEMHSPGWPSGYLGPHDCTLTVILPEIAWIGFYTIDFVMEQTASGCRDSVTIRNQEYPQNGTIRCGNITAHQLLYHDSSFHSTEKIDVRFQAKPFLEQEGAPEQKFVIEYTVADIIYPGVNYNHSKPVVIHGYGYVVSHASFGSKDRHYESNIDSYFTLTDIEPNTVLEVYFITFQLHHSANCDDHLTISGVSEAPFSQEPFKLCGSRADNTAYEVVSLGTTMTFHFKTDNWDGSEGFRIQYHVKGYLNLESSSSAYTEDSGYIKDGVLLTSTDSSDSSTKQSNITTESSADGNIKKMDKGKNHRYMYLGIGIGAGNLVIVIFVTLAIVFFVRNRKKKRLSKDSSKRSRYTDSVRTGPLPPTGNGYDNRSKLNGGSSGELYDDESAYYSEIGTFQKRNDREEPDIHYASRAVCDANFYHLVDGSNNPPAPPTHPISFIARPPVGPVVMPPTAHREEDYHIPPYPIPTTNNAVYSYTKTEDRLNAVRIEYQPRSWKYSHGVERF